MSVSRPSMRPARLILALALCGWAVMTAPASAGPITVGDWWEFGFADAGTPATGCDPADPAGPFCTPSSGTPTSFLDAPAWTFDAPAGGATLTVIDAFLSGDRFEIFDFGISLGLTSLPGGASAVDCGDDPAFCLTTAAMSRGVFALAAGSHSLTLTPVASIAGGGAGYLQLVEGISAAVPEPATLLLVSTGLGLAGLGRRRRARG